MKFIFFKKKEKKSECKKKCMSDTCGQENKEKKRKEKKEQYEYFHNINKKEKKGVCILWTLSMMEKDSFSAGLSASVCLYKQTTT